MSTEFESRWYVAQTHPHAEAKAFEHLRRQAYDVYLPRILKQRRHARRIETIAAPLFPRYMFVGMGLAGQRWHPIRSTVGIARLICDSEGPAQVPCSVIEALRNREDSNGFVKLDRQPRFQRGDKIRVVEGAFCDCLALYEGMSNHERVAILLELLGRKVRIVLDPDMIDAA
jgi:transcriptional antiterminator RfaH